MATPTKRTTAKKSATTRTAKSKRPSFDERRQAIIEDRNTTNVFEWEVYDRIWHLKRPNVAVLGELEDDESISSITLIIVSHLIKEEREDFLKALADDEELDFDLIGAMLTDMQEVVYTEIPTAPSSDS